MKHFIRYIVIPIIILTVTACRDDLLQDETIGEGNARIAATLDFKPMSAALTETRAAGNVQKGITSLHVLLYDFDTKELKKSWQLTNYTISDADRTDADADNGISAETTTRRASFNLPDEIYFGKYYMYAVANIPDLLENSVYSKAIATVDGLKNLPLSWNPENMAANGQMIGHFTNASNPTEQEALVLNEKNATLHAWMRRAASKVTVAFDGSNLKDGVSIYLKAVRIKNIPRSCLLGTNNAAKASNDLIQTGEEVVYTTSTSYDADYPALITNTIPFYPRAQAMGDDGTMTWIKNPASHSETNPNSLFFYENMQGTGDNKQQIDNNHDGILDEMYQYQKKPYATFIEVDAHYESTNPQRPGICNITYRFMLGQNISTDYNAKRNCHYKLTLHFKGFADEPDWRIDYVTRLWADEPKKVDYRGKYFEADNVSANQGDTFKNDNVITVTSFMYENDSWYDRIKQEFKIEYKDADSDDFSTTPPDWLYPLDKTYEGNGVFKLQIKYKNPYRTINLNQILSSTEATPGVVYDLATKNGQESMNTANCYIVESKGTYRFPLVYGNAITNGIETSDAYTYNKWLSEDKILKIFKNYKDTPIKSAYILDDVYGSPSNAPGGLSASLIWQDEPNLVTNIKYDKTAYGHGGIQFTVGDGIKEGNALIALKDEKGTIMWSWHIWVTAIDLSNKIILTNRANQKFEIMPVNLGWCSGGKPIRYYDRHECEVKFTQLIGENSQEGVSKTVKIIQEPHIALPQGNNPYFQWGRKDPFIAGGTEEKTTKTWYNDRNTPLDENPKLMYASNAERVPTYQATAALIQNPDKWQNGPREETAPSNPNPYQPKDRVYFNLWDNSCWDDDDFVIKTIYDPCPPGYHVSSIYTFTGFTASGNNIAVDITQHMYAVTENNMLSEPDYRTGIFEFYTDDTKLISIGFPQNGYRDWDDNALLHSINTQGQIWSAQAVPFDWSPPYNAYNFEYSRYVYIRPQNNFYATDGFPVRPSITLP